MTDVAPAEVVATGTYRWDGDRAAFAKAFVAAQASMEAVKKAATNPAFKSKYADLSAVVESVVPALNGAGIGVIQLPSFDGEMLTITTILLHETGASLTGDLALRPSKLDPQGLGSATTYGRRYALLAMTGAAPEDDDGNSASGEREPAQQRSRPQQSTKKEPTLKERADLFEDVLRNTAPADLEKAWAKGSQLCAALDTSDPDRLAELTQLYEQLNDPIPF